MPATTPSRLPESRPSRILSALADKALAFADGQADRTPAALSRTLYEYNRLPATQFWLQRWPDAAAVRDTVGRFDAIGSAYHAFPVATAGWLQWQPKRTEPAQRASGLLKLYISPLPESVNDALGAALPVLAHHGAPVFKVGGDAFGLLRPDKIVVYLQDATDARALADELSAALSGCPHQGVPFTAALGSGAVLSWGVDPPALGSVGPVSWRLWIVTRLAELLAGRPASRSLGGAVRACLSDLRIDPESWAPTPPLAREFLQTPVQSHA